MLGVVKIVVLIFLGFGLGTLLNEYAHTVKELEKMQLMCNTLSENNQKITEEYDAICRDILVADNMTDKDMKERYFSQLASRIRNS